MAVTVGGIIDAVGTLAPWDMAEAWDNCGLQAGDRGLIVRTVLVALDLGNDEVAAAEKAGAELLLTHHPLLLDPVKRIDFGDPRGALLARIIRSGLSAVSAHTNLDAAPGGLADRLAHKLGLGNVRNLSPSQTEGLMKLVVFVPQDHLALLEEALTQVGAGRIGNYIGCSFSAAGTGTFIPMQGSRPYRGRPGERERVPEARLETLIHRRRAAEALEAVKKVHPYEEPAVDLYPLEGKDQESGIGRVGERAIPPDRFIQAVKEALPCRRVRTVGRPPEVVRRVAVLPGSGGGYVASAKRSGADTFVTGELRYHQALEAEAVGLWVIEAGHRPTEAEAVPLLGGHLRKTSGERGWELKVIETVAGQDIFSIQ